MSIDFAVRRNGFFGNGLFRSAALALATAAIVGCAGISNMQPPDQSTVASGPVTMRGEFRLNVNQSLQIFLDGVDETAAFNPVYSTAPGTFSLTRALTPGSHTVLATGSFTQYFLIFPVGQSTMTQQTTFVVPGPNLTISPGTPSTTVGGSTTVTITVPQAPNSPIAVNLSTAPGGVASHAATTTIPQGATRSPAVSLTGQAAGTTTLSAGATGYTSATASVSVAPGFTAISPAQGPVGSTVTLTGSGFVAGGEVRFGNVRASNVTVTAPNSLTAVVPNGLSGNYNVTVTMNGVSSASRSFSVVAAPMPPATPAAILFRSSAQDVQTFSFSPASGGSAASLALVDTDAATPQGGIYAVGIAQTPTRVVRSSTADAQAFIVGSPLGLTLGATRGGAGSGTGSAIAISGTTVVRAIDFGIEVGVLNAAGNNLGAFVAVGGTPSATGVAVDILGTLVVRGHSGGIDLFSIGNPAAPARLSGMGTGTGDPSAVGTGVRFINGTTVVRTFPQGVEIFDVSNPASPVRTVVNRQGFVDSAMGTAVAVEPGGGAAIRATSTRLERYPLPLVANAAPTASINGRVSTTGVGVVVVGTNAFRATNDRLEAYNLPGLGAPIADIGATVSAIGVGLAGR